MNPSTFSFGPWLPDLANQGLPSLFGPVLGTIPAVDCSNVTFANGNYYCTPSPVSAGPTLAEQVRGAYTWYDNSGSQEIVFAGLSGGVSALINGAWQVLPFLNAQSVAAVPWKVSTAWAGFVVASPWVLTTTLGTIGTTTVPNLSARVDGGTFHQHGTSTPPHIFTLNVTVLGGTPTAWSWSTTGGTLSSTTAQNPNLTMPMNDTETVNCTVTVNGSPLVATPGTYVTFNDS